MKKIANLMLIVLVVFLLVGCTHKLTRKEAEIQLEKAGMARTITNSLIRSDINDGEMRGMFLKLIRAGFITVVPTTTWEANDKTVTARYSGHSDEKWLVSTSEVPDEEVPVLTNTNGDWLPSDRGFIVGTPTSNGEYMDFTGFPRTDRYVVTINKTSYDGNIGIKDDEMGIIVKSYANFKVTGIIEESPTEDTVNYTVDSTTTPEGAALGESGGNEDRTIKFRLYDDGWRPVLNK